MLSPCHKKIIYSIIYSIRRALMNQGKRPIDFSFFILQWPNRCLRKQTTQKERPASWCPPLHLPFRDNVLLKPGGCPHPSWLAIWDRHFPINLSNPLLKVSIPTPSLMERSREGRVEKRNLKGISVLPFLIQGTREGEETKGAVRKVGSNIFFHWK